MINLKCNILHEFYKKTKTKTPKKNNKSPIVLWHYNKICSNQIRHLWFPNYSRNGFCVREKWPLLLRISFFVLIRLIRNSDKWYTIASTNPSFTSVLLIHENPFIIQNRKLSSCCEKSVLFVMLRFLITIY